MQLRVPRCAWKAASTVNQEFLKHKSMPRPSIAFPPRICPRNRYVPDRISLKNNGVGADGAERGDTIPTWPRAAIGRRRRDECVLLGGRNTSRSCPCWRSRRHPPALMYTTRSEE